ncbi:ribosomal L28 family-domain-containing protein, partial [Usnea florida]
MTLPKPATSLRCLRLFSTTIPTPKPSTDSRPPLYTKAPPPYPYGPALIYKQSNTGLYGGAIIQFGNKVSEQNAHKSRRVWRPNIHSKRLWSDSLGHFVRVKVQARVLRTITKCGGLDEYLLGEKPARIKELGLEGWRLRWLVMKSDKVRERFAREREKLGL